MPKSFFLIGKTFSSHYSLKTKKPLYRHPARVTPKGFASCCPQLASLLNSFCGEGKCTLAR
jgi:hypothetical protein